MFDMVEGIVDTDLQALLALNPLAAEQLRRIVAERHCDELRADLKALAVASNGADAKVEVSNRS